MGEFPQRSAWSLRHKILLPFFIILLLLGGVATFSFILLLNRAIHETVDDRLNSGRDVIFREIKNQEFLLQNYAELIGYAYRLPPSGRASQSFPPEHEELLASLARSDIQAEFLPVARWQELPASDLRELIDHAIRSGRPRFRFLNSAQMPPTLTVACLLPEGARDGQVLILRTAIKASFLSAHSIGFGARTSLMNLSGGILTASDPEHLPPSLSPDQLATVIGGQTLIRVGNSSKYLYSAIPLGTSELVLTVIEIPMNSLDALVNDLTLQGIATLAFFVLMGGLLYYELLQRQIMAPVQSLLKATQALSWGNFDFRIEKPKQDELGQVAQSFNLMAEKLRTLYADSLRQEKELAAAEEELRYQSLLTDKNRQIEEANAELTAHVNELSALFSLIQDMIGSLDLDVLFGRVLQIIKDVVPCDELLLLLYQDEERLQISKTLGLNPARKYRELFDGRSILMEEISHRQECLHVRDLEEDQRFEDYLRDYPETRSLLCVPMILKEQILGVINLHKKEVGGFSEREIRLVQAITAQAAIAIENARLYQQTRDLSNTDSLTRLANRRFFQAALDKEFAQARRYGTNFSLIMIDIDHFKRYNDAHGHLQGDKVLRDVAQILQDNIRGIDLAARFGGEEFIILMPKTNKEGARAAAEKLRLCVAEREFMGAAESQPEGHLTLSLGIAEFPEDADSLETLQEQADQALYQAKKEGRNQTVAWNSTAPPLPYLNVPPLS
ncbi:diguanylate cyclase [Trichloromonas acetexigens]|uniref:diguanylate cyclase n=1 Tax=Trichloromonas acetexigens TaxID=38815 RepID=A0A550JKJ4_9BACT|nr:diguanylate cyclase [Desulfuromonas acetexigens]TRO83715.1 diguanylate cyclase [Desulfuromonas acetexigens]